MAQAGDGYVGNAHDAARIQRLGKEREAGRKAFEEAQKLRQERIEKAGVRKFASATTEVRAS